MSNSMPSTTSICTPKVLDSSTVMTPSLPTFSMAVAISRPMASSPAEMVPTLAICSKVSTLWASSWIWATRASTAFSMPRRRESGDAPAVTFFRPSVIMTSASRVAVVVPSPAASLVLTAASRMSMAPMFSMLSSSSISLATVTPSLVISGEPKLRWQAT